MNDSSKATLVAGDDIEGFRVRRVIPLKELQATFHHLDHLATGAQHIHIANADTENTFGVAFKTVPTDSTGVAHILEHTALCGSRDYPIRDPFFSMLKRSLSTFMNAFTASDWTMYPYSTQNRKDFYNLMKVYMDAAFFPRLEELSFKQEGHRLEVLGPSPAQGDERLVFQGVVYNEMKGAMSSPNQVMARSLLNALYPSTTYRFNSGGDPEVIPDLTYEQLKAFHQRHYHPSNAFFYTYGNLPLRDHLAFIERRVLRHFGRINPGTDVPSQDRWDAPREKRYTYPLDKTEDPTNKAQVALAWLTVDIRDAFEVLVLTVIEQILLGNPASPLRKALIDSRLGTALSDGSGFDADNRDTLFACGLKDVAVEDADKIEAIIFGVLQDLVTAGIPESLIASAIHQIEFHRKEVTNTPYPYGLRLLLTMSSVWFHGGEPERVLQFDDDLADLKARLAKGRFLEERIDRYFLSNNHRVRITLAPDHRKADIDAQKEVKRLDTLKGTLSAADLEKIKNDAALLNRLQDAVEDVSCLPTLARSDIPAEVERLQPNEADDGRGILWYEQPTSGIFYFSSVVGIHNVPADLIWLVPFFCAAFSRAGTADHDYTEIAQRIDLYTGGVGAAFQARTRHDETGDCLPLVGINSKCLAHNLGPMFDLLGELTFRCQFRDTARLKSLLLEYQAGIESAIVQNGHRLAMSLAARHSSASAFLNELWSGVHQLKKIKQLTEGVKDSGRETAALSALADDLNAIGRAVFEQTRPEIALIGELGALSAADPLINGYCSGFGNAAASRFECPPLHPDNAPPFDGWSTSTAVSFVAESIPTVRLTHRDAPALAVIGKMMRSLYLHREIREKGGAYGGFSLYNPELGVFSLASYRDPHICATLDAFAGVKRFICSGKYSDEDIKEAVLQVCSDIDKPDAPGAAARKAFLRRLVGLEDDARLRYKQAVLEITRDQIADAATTYFGSVSPHKGVAVISSEEKLVAANDKLAGGALTIYRI